MLAYLLTYPPLLTLFSLQARPNSTKSSSAHIHPSPHAPDIILTPLTHNAAPPQSPLHPPLITTVRSGYLASPNPAHSLHRTLETEIET